MMIKLRIKQLNIWCILVIVLSTLLLLIMIISHGSEILDTEEMTILEPTGHGLQQMLLMLTNAVSIEPVTDVNNSCGVPLIPSEMPSCHGQSALSGELLDIPRKIVLMIMFAFEVDTLEIALRQQQDMVDKIFLIESSFTHRGTEKILLWERLQFSERFQFVDKQKLVHIVADDLHNGNWSLKEWEAESDQGTAGVNRIKSWANSTKLLTDNDILISGSVDEILSRDVLQQLRWCQLSSNSDVFFGGLWVPLGNLNKAHREESTCGGEDPHLFLQPSIYRWKSVFEGKLSGIRQPGFKNEDSLTVIGGIHLTHGAFLPNSIIKEVTATENDFYEGSSVNWNHLLTANIEELNIEQKRVYDLFYRKYFDNLRDPIEELPHISPKVPEYLLCNKERFPYWFGREDQRNAIFHSIIRKFVTINEITLSPDKNCKYLLKLTYVSIEDNASIYGKLPICNMNNE